MEEGAETECACLGAVRGGRSPHVQERLVEFKEKDEGTQLSTSQARIQMCKRP